MSEIRVDTIAEKTSANGVAIDSVTLKDGGVTGTAAIVAGGGNGPTLGFQLKDTSGNAQPRLTNDANNDTVIRPGASGRQIMLANYANNATALNVDDSGHVTKPLQPAFNVKPTSDQNNLANNTQIAFGTENFDVGSNFASNIFTAPVTGKYQLNLQIRLNDIDSAANYVYIQIITSNRNYQAIFDPRQFNGDLVYFYMHISAVADMDASDTAQVYFYQSGGTAQSDVENGGTNFSGCLLA